MSKLLLIALIFSFSLQALASEILIQLPRINGYEVDACIMDGQQTNCEGYGKEKAADAACGALGFGHSVSSETYQSSPVKTLRLKIKYRNGREWRTQWEYCASCAKRIRNLICTR